ncbi:MAG: nickel pincer cofactor biosynthesis protein LarC [Acidobacteriota bacterium]|nr:nickel pincer cofactor biosynthesis protein LarC [Acidobacteriota bacterium]
MRIASLDCFAGASGDMFLAALVDAGVPAEVLHQATAALQLGATLHIHTVDRSGISATKVDVMVNGTPADAPAVASQPVAAQQEPLHQHSHTHSHHPRTQHEHKAGHPHSHDHSHSHDHPHEHAPSAEHQHGRSLSVIRSLILNAALPQPVKDLALHTFQLLGQAEAKIHNVPVEQIHFHEVGAVDAIVDIVAASAGVHALNTQALAETGQPLRWHCSPINTGSGMVQCAHGNFPIPAPATADLLLGMPTYAAHVQKELVTPTGAALLRALAPQFGPQPVMRVRSIGYGAGTRNPAGFPNVLRLSVGDTDEATTQDASGAASTVTVIETALDDLSPQVIAHVMERALALGALDAMLTPVQMKKGRPGTLLTLLAAPAQAAELTQLLLRETSTLGVRTRVEQRICLERSHVPVQTPYGAIRIKVGTAADETRNAAPEFEDCRAAAAQHQVPVKLVLQAATAAWLAHAKPGDCA